MQFIVVAHRSEKHKPEDFEPYLQPEAKKALELVAEGFVRQIWGRGDGKGAILLIEAESEDEVKKRLGELPLRQQGLLDAEIYAVGPYRGIALAAEKF